METSTFQEMLSLKILLADQTCPGVGCLDARQADWSDTFPSHSFTGAVLLDRATSPEGMGARPEEHLVTGFTGRHRYLRTES